MKLILNVLFLLLSLLALFAVAKDQPHRQIIVSYPKGTPEYILTEAKEAVRKAGGEILHEYNLIMGFAAKTSAKVVDSLQAMGAGNNVLIEEDKTVSINDS